MLDSVPEPGSRGNTGCAVPRSAGRHRCRRRAEPLASVTDVFHE